MNILILFATSLGSAETVAGSLAERLQANNHHCEIENVASFPAAYLAREDRPVIICASTWGEGDPPDEAVDFWEHLQKVQESALSKLRFAVYALGDRCYEDFCGFGRKLDEYLSSKGAVRLLERVDNDTDYEENLHAFGADVLYVIEKLAAEAPSHAQS